LLQYEEMIDVRTDKSELHLRDRAMKDKEQEEKRIALELKEREEQAKNEDLYDNTKTLRFYSMRRVTAMRLEENIIAKRAELERLEKILYEKVYAELIALEKEYPEYEDQWIKCFDEERAKSGISPFVPSATQFDEYNKYRKNLAQSNKIHDTDPQNELPLPRTENNNSLKTRDESSEPRESNP
jgi:hypothetical protein